MQERLEINPWACHWTIPHNDVGNHTYVRKVTKRIVKVNLIMARLRLAVIM